MNSKISVFRFFLIFSFPAFFLAMRAVGAENPSARKFQEITRDINKDVNTVKSNLDKVKNEHLKNTVTKQQTDDQVKFRKEAVNELVAARNLYKENTNQENEMRLRGAINEYVKNSNNLYENLKSRILYNEKTVNIVSDGLAKIIMKMKKLETLANTMDKNSPDLKKLQVTIKQQMKSTLDIVGQFAHKGSLSERQHARIKKAIAMQYRHFKKQNVRWRKAYSHIGEERERYEHVLGQLQIVKRELELEKNLLASMIDNDIARSLLLKLSGALIGNGSISDVASNMLAEIDQRVKVSGEIRKQNDKLDGVTEDSWENPSDPSVDETLEELKNDPDLV